MKLQGVIDTASISFDFDTGLPSLPIAFEVAGSLDVTARYAFDLAFSFDSSSVAQLIEGSNLQGVQPPAPNTKSSMPATTPWRFS